jgi:uncharacterized protein
VTLRRFLASIAVLFAAWAGIFAHAAEGDFQPVPPLKQRVTDLTATLSAADEARIDARLREFEANKGAQIAVLIIGTTQPEPAFDYSMRVVDAWKLGRKDVDDGVLFLVAKNDRKLEIRTGRGVQGTLTDAMSKRIISEVVAPRFRSGDFAGGIEQGVEKIIAVLQGEALPPPAKKRVAAQQVNYEGFLIMGVIAALVVGPMLRALLGRFLGATATGGVTGAAAWWLAGGLIFPAVMGAIIFLVVLLSGGINLAGARRSGAWSTGGWSGGGSSGGGWSGGSSDSFSGGGGGFDGGGASGDW